MVTPNLRTELPPGQSGQVKPMPTEAKKRGIKTMLETAAGKKDEREDQE